MANRLLSSVETTETTRAARARQEGRLAPRRPTHIFVEALDGTTLGSDCVVSDLSSEGAWLRTRQQIEPGTSMRVRLDLPTHNRPIDASVKVVRRGNRGIGVRFLELSARDRSRLREHAGYLEMDDAIVRLQRHLEDVLPGNLLPLAERSEIFDVLTSAVDDAVPVTLVTERGRLPNAGVLSELQPASSNSRPSIRIVGARLASNSQLRVMYTSFAHGALHYAFEALVLEPGNSPRVLVPERIYVTERRTNGRSGALRGYCEFPAPHNDGAFRFTILDAGTDGVSIGVPENTPLFVGSHLPAFGLCVDDTRTEIPGAIVRYVTPLREGLWRAGLHFDTGEPSRNTFDNLQKASVRSGFGSRLRRAYQVAMSKTRQLLTGNETSIQAGVEVVRYRNEKGLTVAGIIDANFDTSDPSIHPDLAVILAPALLKRKEVFALQARTLLDDLGRDGHKVAVLRFDYCNIIGESSMDPELVAAGTPYLNWHIGELVDDTQASLRYLEKRFRPKKRALVSYSFAAIGARLVVKRAEPMVDHWVAPFGCPDMQDMLRNYLAGLDLYPQYEAGEGPETIFIHNRPVRGHNVCMQARDLGLAYLEQGREHISEISTPITWLLGTYDHWVTRSRVKALLEAPGNGVREVFECATGHVLKNGPEAIEVFKLVSESISKHIFGSDRAACDPDLERFNDQSRAEWSRVKRLRLGDASAFWREHLFGDDGDPLAYDIVLDHPDFPKFMRRQAELLDIAGGKHIADFGCGTGNLVAEMIDAYPDGEGAEQIALLDIVPEALDAAQRKIEAACLARRQANPVTSHLGANLEISRIAPVKDFLDGREWGVQALVGRLDGLSHTTAGKVAESYGRELHEVLRGRPSHSERLRQLCPDFDDEDTESVLDFSRAARFLLGRSLPADLIEGRDRAETTDDLRLDRLVLHGSGRDTQLPLPDGSFDRIGCSLVISYLSDPIVALREMHRLLKPGGILVVSSLLPNFDGSKLYSEEATLLSQRAADDPESERKLVALRHFANMVSRLVELEEDGRFRFWRGKELQKLLQEAGFGRVDVFEGLGSPAAATIARARR